MTSKIWTKECSKKVVVWLVSYKLKVPSAVSSLVVQVCGGDIRTVNKKASLCAGVYQPVLREWLFKIVSPCCQVGVCICLNVPNDNV